MKTSSLTRTLLEHLAENKHLLIDAVLPRHPRSRLARAMLGLDRRRYQSAKVAKHSISTLLCRLRKEGLVAHTGPKSKTVWKITEKGRKRLRDTPSQVFTIPDFELPPEDSIIRLVSFDIPERERRKRDWLRKILLASDYRILHKSVFIGKRPLPDEALEDIATIGLKPYIHLVSIDKKGTLVPE